MRAIVIEEFGGPEVFKEADVPVPELRHGHLLVRVLASSVNPVDYKVRAGLIPPITPAFPAVLGCDVAGLVEGVGAGVSGFAAGDEVYFCAGSPAGIGGALAEYCLVDAAQVAKKPQSLSFEDAAALPLVMITAWDGLIDRAKVGAGMASVTRTSPLENAFAPVTLARQSTRWPMVSTGRADDTE